MAKDFITDEEMQQLDTGELEQLKQVIGAVESNQDYAAANPKSSARGRYQFLKDQQATRVWEHEAGLEGPGDWVISPDDPDEVKLRKADNQDKLLRTAYERDYSPNVDKIIEASGGKLSRIQAIALQHFRGLEGALEYARTGKEPDDKLNIPIKKYLERVSTPAEAPDFIPDEQAPEEDGGALRAFGHATAQSALFEFLDEAVGKVRAAEEMNIDKWASLLPEKALVALGKLKPEEVAKYNELYTTYRDTERVALEAERRNYPWATAAGMIAGVIPTAFIPIVGTAGRGLSTARALGTIAGVEGTLGALYGTGEAAEQEDIPERAATAALVSGSFGVGLGAAARGMSWLSRKGQSKLANIVADWDAREGQKLTQRVDDALDEARPVEDALSNTARMERVAQHLDDPVEWSRRADAEDIEKLASIAEERITKETRAAFPEEAARKQLAHHVALQARLKWARFRLGPEAKGLSDSELLARLDDWIAEAGPSHAAASWRESRKYEHMNDLVDRGLIRRAGERDGGSWMPPWIRRAAMFMTDARYAMNAIDRKWGTETVVLLNEAAEGYNKYNRMREVFISRLRDIHKDVRRSGIYDSDTYRFMRGDRQFEESAPRLYLALDHPEYAARLEPAQAAAVRKVQDYYDALRTEALRMGLPVGRVKNYVPHFTKDTPEFIRAIKERADELRVPYGGGTEITEASLSKLVRGLDEDGVRKLNELKTGLRMISSENLETAEGWRRALNAINDVKYVHSKLETRASQVLHRTNHYLPVFIREVDAMKLADRWAQQVYRHAWLRQPMMEMRTLAKFLRNNGDHNAAGYLENWLADVAGTRVNTLSGNARAFMTSVQIKLDDMIKDTDSGTARTFYRGLKSIPDVMEMASGIVYSNLLGFNARVILRNMTQPFLMSAPELGGTYGQKLALKSQLAVAPQYVGSKFRGSTLMEESGMVAAGLAPAKWTGEAVDVLERSMRQSLPASAVRKYSRVAMWLYEKSDHHNRLVTWKMAQYLADDMVSGLRKMVAKQDVMANERAALGFIRNMEAGYRTRMRRLAAAGDEQALRRTLASYMVGKTQFHYNKIAMSEYGRFAGTLFSMFTKWPMSISGHMGDMVLDRGMSEGMRNVGRKYLGPLIMLGALDKFVMPDPSESDTAKLLIGRGGLAGWTPAQAALGYMTGQFTTPPIVDSAMKVLTLGAAEASFKGGDGSKFMNWVNQSFRYWTPGYSFMRFVFDDIPTVATGDNPEYLGR